MAEGGSAASGSAVEQVGLGEDEGDAGVGEHEVPAVGRVVGIEGQVGRAGLEGGEQGDDLVERAGDRDADEGLTVNAVGAAGAVGDEVVGQAVGAGVELGVGVGGGRVGAGDEDGGGRVGGAGGPVLEEGVDGPVGQGCGGGVPGGELGLLFGREQGQGADGPVGVGGGCGEQLLQVAGHAPDSGLVEEVDIVLERAGEAGRRFDHRERQVELRDLRVHLDGQQREPGQVHAAPGHVLHGEYDLEHGAVAQVAGRPPRQPGECVDQHLEGQVLVGIRAQRGFLDTAELAAGTRDCPHTARASPAC